jgi:hypothetical protein
LHSFELLALDRPLSLDEVCFRDAPRYLTRKAYKAQAGIRCIFEATSKEKAVFNRYPLM